MRKTHGDEHAENGDWTQGSKTTEIYTYTPVNYSGIRQRIDYSGMAVFKLAADGSHWFVTHGFRAEGKSFIVTYQISDKALQVLSHAGCKNGDKIPEELFRSLMESGEFFTGQTGAMGERTGKLSSSQIKDAPSVRPFVLPPPTTLPPGLDRVRKVSLFMADDKWVIATRGGTHLASFASEEEAEKWWKKSCESRGVLYKIPSRRPAFPRKEISRDTPSATKQSISPAKASLWQLNKWASGGANQVRKRCRCGNIAIPGDDYCFSCRN